mmetsp:Transcript_10145/g.18120  ORF Transcript_10145/g.18120 Transcript_10145/m.18120 type:complete len:280 (-) Transcript_10145:158-997(-)
MNGCSEATRKTFLTYLNRGCYMPVIYGNGYRICQELIWQSGQLKVQVRSSSDFSCLDTASTCDEGDSFSRLSSITSEAECENERAVSSAKLLKAVRKSISSLANFAGIVSFPNSGDMATSKMVSQGFEELSGYSKKECLGKDMRFLTFSGEDDIADIMARNLSDRTGASTITDTCMLTKHGDLKPCRVLRRGLSLGFDPESEERKWVVLSVYEDVTKSSADKLDMHLSEVAEHIRNLISHTISALDATMLQGAASIPQGCWFILQSCPWHAVPIEPYSF